jgi:hypothetical protein
MKNELNKAKINIKLARSKGLVKDDDYTIYLRLQEFYKKALDMYLLRSSSITKYNDEIKNSELDFGVMPESNKNPYHKFSFLNLDYIYVRNFIFIEKLNIETINFLVERININNYDIDDHLLKMIDLTYKDVIVDNYRNDTYEEDAETCYGPALPTNFVLSNKLTLSIQYGKNKEQLEKEEFYKNQNEKDKFLKQLTEEIEQSIGKELKMETKVLIRNFVGEY